MLDFIVIWQDHKIKLIAGLNILCLWYDSPFFQISGFSDMSVALPVCLKIHIPADFTLSAQYSVTGMEPGHL